MNKKNVANKKIVKQKKGNSKIKRNVNRIEDKSLQLKMFGVNAAGIKCKLDSFNDILNRVKPQIWAVQETKLRKNEVLKCDAVKKYQVFYLYRENSQGLAIGVDKDI